MGVINRFTKEIKMFVKIRTAKRRNRLREQWQRRYALRSTFSDGPFNKEHPIFKVQHRDETIVRTKLRRKAARNG